MSPFVVKILIAVSFLGIGFMLGAIWAWTIKGREVDVSLKRDEHEDLTWQ